MKFITGFVFIICAILDLKIPSGQTTASQLIKNESYVLFKRDTNLNALTDADKLKYDLVVSLDSVVNTKECEKRMSLFRFEKVYKVNVILKNKSKDTLRYIDWTCESKIWHIDNNKMSVLAPFLVDNCGDCTANYISEFKVLPFSSTQLYVYVNKKSRNLKKIKFKIGMILQRIIKPADYQSYEHYFFGTKNNLRDQKMNIIWSNSIVMP